MKTRLAFPFAIVLSFGLVLLLLAGLPGASRADIGGSGVNAVIPADLAPGVSVEVCFNVSVSSADDEYVDRFEVDLPDDWVVDAVAANSSPPADGGYGCYTTVSSTYSTTEKVVYWQTDPYPSGCGAWDPGTYDFCVDVTVPDCTGAPWSLPWAIIGDYYEDTVDPHIVNGTIQVTCGTPRPILRLAKAIESPFAPPGAPVTYTLVFTNRGNATAAGVILTDSLPPALVNPAVVGSSGAAITQTGSPPNLAWSVQDLAPGQGGIITLSGVLSPSQLLGDLVTNTASITSPQALASHTGSATLEVCSTQITVTNPADGGPGSLRQAAADVCPGGRIDFALSYPAVISLTSGEVWIDRPLTLNGPGPDQLAVSGNGTSRVFGVDDPAGSGQITVTISGLTIRDGAADDGGGLWNDEYLSLVNVTFSDNHAVYGGGMYNSYSDPVLTDVAFSGNIAVDGGGMYNSYSDPALANVTFSGNRAGDGGGMYNLNSQAHLTNVSFHANQASGDGGGMFNTDSDPVLTNVAFSGNRSDRGGGLFNYSSSPALANVAFSGNRANDGGGLYNLTNSQPRLTNVTLSGNRASGDGGGLYNYFWSDCSIQNSLVWGNEPDQVYNKYSDPTIAFSDIQGSGGSGPAWGTVVGLDGGGNLDVDPRFVNPVDPMVAPTMAGDLHLRPGSPAIDAGDAALVPTDTLDLDGDGDTAEALPFDLAGQPRVAYGGVDMGAYEFQPGLYLLKSVNPASQAAGQRITYTLTALNTFTDTTIGGGVISDSLPPRLTFAGPITLDPPTAGTAGTAPPTLVTGLGIGPGGVVTITFPVTIQAGLLTGLRVANTAAITSEQTPAPYLAYAATRVCGGSSMLVTNTVDHVSSQPEPGTLRQAVAEVCPGGQIDFALTYPAAITLTGGELLIDKALSLNGPGAGQLAISGGGASRVFKIDRPGGAGQIAVSLSGITIRDGSANEGGGMWSDENPVLTDVLFTNNTATVGGGLYSTNGGSPSLRAVSFISNAAANGGGMCSSGGAPALTNVTFVSNTASNVGGGMYGDVAHPTLTNVDFRANESASRGGALYSQRGSLVLMGVTFSANRSSDGGGLYNYEGSPVLTDITFDANIAARGGGLYNYNNKLILTDVTFNANQADEGGGLYNYEGSPSLTDVTFSTNRATSGGAIYNDTAALTLFDAAIVSNTATGNGGGTYAYNGAVTMTNSTVGGNVGSGGAGGIRSNGGTVTLVNTTIRANQGITGGGLRVLNGEIILHNSIVAENSGSSDCVVEANASINSLGYNLDSDGTCSLAAAGDISHTNPLLGPLADYGGGTLSYALLPNSPAIDAGDPAACPPTDQRGQPRGDLRCDIGAYELQLADSDTVVKTGLSAPSMASFGPTLISVTVTGGDAGTITATRRSAYPGGSQDPGELPSTWYLTSTGSAFTLTLGFCYTEADLVGLNESSLGVFRWEDSGTGYNWVLKPSTVTSHCVVVSDVTGLSAWTLFDVSQAPNQPTAITLGTLTAKEPQWPVASLVASLLVLGMAAALGSQRRRA
ncbi:MAG: DUF11 domain-containing protein [Thermoflexales bacterium]|nr:DUF11 domain-containing protein [Thermoflexales bacterium]